MRISAHPKLLWPLIHILTVILLSVSFSGCGGGNGGGSSGDDEASADATLASLTLSGAEQDQIFQSSQTTYTESVEYAIDSITVIPTATNSKATITVNGTAVNSNTASQANALAVGTKLIGIVLTAEDASTTQTYNITATGKAHLMPRSLI